MLRDISELLKGLMQEERKRLDEYELKHGPTIGKMYEGLASDILGRAIPDKLNLQLRHGIIHNGLGDMTGEIDCMLVKGDGEKIPFTDSYKWHIKDVIAVIEVKKTLYSKDLRDAFEHLRGVSENFSKFVEFGSDSSRINIDPIVKAFSEATGVVPPKHRDVHALGVEKEMLYHTFVMEYISPIRIVLGYHGFKKEESLREALASFLEENLMTYGFGVGSFPQLIICGNYSLIKMNGYPYSAPMNSEFWDFYASSNSNPVLLILELIWTKLSYEIAVQNLWGEDLLVENFARFLSAKIKTVGEMVGWEYKYTPLSENYLSNRLPDEEWLPTFVTSSQFVIFNNLCNGLEARVDDPTLKDFIERKGECFETFIQSLVQTGLIALNNGNAELTTKECGCVILPDGRFAVAENNSGRLTRWVRKQSDRSRKD